MKIFSRTFFLQNAHPYVIYPPYLSISLKLRSPKLV